MKKIIVILLGLGCYSQLSEAQVTNNGQLVHLNAGAIMHINDDYVHKAGTVSNNGKLTVNGNWTNDDVAGVVFDKDSKGTVYFSGDDDQVIAGVSITIFPSLVLSGGLNKWLASSIVIRDTLDLKDTQLHAELVPKPITIHITNPDSGAIKRTVGFISTDHNGSLLRNTNSTEQYLFPLGNVANSTFLYRPLHFKPKDALDNTFSASLINTDPSNNGFDKTKKRYDIQNVFDKYYFLLGQKSGSSKFNVTFYQNSELEKTSTQLVSWEKYYSVWGKASPSTITKANFGDDLTGSTLNTSILYTAPETFYNMPFTFSGATGNVNPFTFFNAISPDGDGKNDTWHIKNIELYPDNKLSIFNRWGDEVYNAKGYTNQTAWNGANVQSGTYYYVLTATIDGKPQVFKGFITMIKKD